MKNRAPIASVRWQARIHAVLGERDAAARLLQYRIFDQNLEILTRDDPDRLPLGRIPALRTGASAAPLMLEAVLTGFGR